MRGLKGLSKLVVVAITAATLMLMAAVGGSAASGTFGSTKAVTSVLSALSHNSVARSDDGNKNDNKCKGDNDDHANATPGHENHPCDDGGGHGGGHGGGGKWPQPLTLGDRGPVAATFAQWILRIAVFFLPLAFLPNIVDEFVLPKLLLARLFVAVSGIVLLVGWLQHGTVTWKRTPLDLPLLAFIGSAALSTIFAINRNVGFFGTYDRWEGLLTVATYGLVFWLAVQLLSGEADARGLIWSLLLSGYVIAAVAILQSAFGVLGGGYFHGANNIIRPDVTLANPDFLGIFLALLLPVAFAKLISRRPITTRVLAANLVIVLFLGLLASFTRAAWIGAVLGVVVVLVLRQGRFDIWPLVISASVLVIGFAVFAGIAAARPSSGGGGIGQALIARIASIADIGSGTQKERITTWGDTLPLIASRPILGYGPDTFGLVYPQFESSNQHFVLWDKPHQDALGVAASQGIIGLFAYIWILVAFVRAFWQGRSQRGAVALFAGWVAYVVSIQFDFSWIPTSEQFWLFAAAAIVTWAPTLPSPASGGGEAQAKFP